MIENAELTISNTLKNLGITPGILGYAYLREAIKLTLDDMSFVHNLTKEVYPAIAKKFDTTPAKAERSIRHAIEKAWSIQGIECRDTMFGNSIDAFKGKPTNGEFIATVADYLEVTHGS